MDIVRKCNKCTVEKKETDFYFFKGKPHGPCKECVKDLNAKRKLREGYTETQRLNRCKRRLEDPTFIERERENRRNSYRRNKWKSMYYGAKARAKRNGIEFNIELEDINIPTHCPLLGIELKTGTKKVYENSPSLDRIDNTKGYVKGNVMVISKKANSMKNSATIEELKTFCNNVLNMIQHMI